MEISPPPYFDELKDIRVALEANKESYPYNGCSHASRVVSLILGLREVAGSFTFKYYYGSPTDTIHREWHAWNYDPGRELYVDLSADQFGDFPKVFVTKKPARSCYQESKIETVEQAGCRLELASVLKACV